MALQSPSLDLVAGAGVAVRPVAVARGYWQSVGRRLRVRQVRVCRGDADRLERHIEAIDRRLRDDDRDRNVAAFVKDTPLNRFGTVAEVAELVVFLASDEAPYITGSEFDIDGGLLAGSTASPGAD